MTKYHRLGDLKNRNLFSCSFRGRKSRVEVPADPALGEGAHSGLQAAASSLRPDTAFPQCRHLREKESHLSGVSSYNPIGSGPHSHDLISPY